MRRLDLTSCRPFYCQVRSFGVGQNVKLPGCGGAAGQKRPVAAAELTRLNTLRPSRAASLAAYRTHTSSATALPRAPPFL